MSNDGPMIHPPAPTGPRPVDPHAGPNRAARREQAREDRLEGKRLRKAVANIEHVLRRGSRR